MKRKVHPPKITSNFRWHSRYFHFRNNVYFNTHLFCTFNFFTGTGLLSFVIGFWWPTFWPLALSLFTYMFYAWFRTERLAQGLSIRRRLPERGREKDVFEIHYDVSNETGFSPPAFSFRQPFTGVQEGSLVVRTPGNIPPQSKLRITVKPVLDAGMGVKEIGDFSVHIHDELSLFPFEVEFTGNS